MKIFVIVHDMIQYPLWHQTYLYNIKWIVEVLNGLKWQNGDDLLELFLFFITNKTGSLRSQQLSTDKQHYFQVVE